MIYYKTWTGTSLRCLSCNLLWLSFCCPDQFPYHTVLQLLGVNILWLTENTSSALKLYEDFWVIVSWNSKFLCYYCSLARILSHLHYVHPHFLGTFCYDFRCKNFFPFFKKKSNVIFKYYQLSVISPAK